jgi:hypothetical protein
MPQTIAFPFALDPVTGVRLVEQDSEEHVLGRCGLVLATPAGWFDSLPAFGVSELLHDQAPDTETLRAAVEPWEPRVGEITDDELSFLGETTLTVTADG